MGIKSKPLRDSARNEDCTFQIAGVCNHNPETVVLCHINCDPSGVGQKADDTSAAYGCSSCHDVVDGRVQNEEYKQYKWFYNARAIARTTKRFYEKGLIVIKGAK